MIAIKVFALQFFHKTIFMRLGLQQMRPARLFYNNATETSKPEDLSPHHIPVVPVTGCEDVASSSTTTASTVYVS